MKIFNDYISPLQKLGRGGVLNPASSSIIPSGAIAYWNTSTLNTNANVLLDMVGGSAAISTTRAGDVNAVYDSALVNYGNNVVALEDEGALIQKAATNLANDSDLTNWTVNGITQAIGDLTEAGIVFTKLTEIAGGTIHRNYETTTATTGNISFSIDVKKGTRRYIAMSMYVSNSDTQTLVIDTDTDTLASTKTQGSNFTGEVLRTEVITSTITRYTFSTVKASTGATIFQVALSDSASPTYAGDNASPTYSGDTGNYLYVANAQVENALEPSSPIITSGATAARVTDASVMSITPFDRVNDFKLTVRVKFNENATTSRIMWEKTTLSGYFSLDAFQRVETGFTKASLGDYVDNVPTVMGDIHGRTFDMIYTQTTAGATTQVTEVDGLGYDSTTGLVTTAQAKEDVAAWGTTANLLQRAGGTYAVNGNIISVSFEPA